MRALVVTPAHVHAHALGRDARGRRIQRLDIGRGDLQELLLGEVLIARVARHRKIRTVELKLGRGGIEEPADTAALEGAGEAADVLAAGTGIDEPHGPHAARAHELLLAHDGGDLAAQLGERREIERGLALDVPAEARQPLGDVGRVADLAELAAAHDRYPGRLLLRHGLRDRRLYRPLEGLRVVGLAMVAGEEQRPELAAPGQAADVCRQDLPHEGPIAFVGSTYNYVGTAERLEGP